MQFRQRKNLEDPAYRFRKMCEEFKSLNRFILFYMILSLFTMIDFIINNWRPIYSIGLSAAITKYTVFVLAFTVIMAGFSISLGIYLIIKKWID